MLFTFTNSFSSTTISSFGFTDNEKTVFTVPFSRAPYTGLTSMSLSLPAQTSLVYVVRQTNGRVSFRYLKNNTANSYTVTLPAATYYTTYVVPSTAVAGLYDSEGDPQCFLHDLQNADNSAALVTFFPDVFDFDFGN